MDENKSNSGTLKDVNILVIDDEAVIRDGCKKILTKDGWCVDTAVKGSDGIEMIKNRSYDILLLDLMMPGMSGMEVIPQVKALDSEIYIIVITGYATIETAVETMKKGAFDYIPKPFTSDQLRLGVRRVLENKALRMEAEFLRKEQEKGLLAIAQEKSKIRTILNCMPDGVIVVDEDKRIALYNPVAGKLLNISGDEVIGEYINICTGCEEFSRLVMDVLENYPGGQNCIAKEIESEGFVPLLVHIAPVQMEDGRIIGAVIVLQDISDQKLIEKVKSDFITKITHEIKAPAATISQLLMTLLSGSTGELKDSQTSFLNRALVWSDEIIELVSDLLNLSKSEAGLVIKKLAPMKINDVLDQAVDVIKPQADKKKIRININLNGSLPMVNGDCDGIRDVFTNLLGNAVKYSDDETEISVSGELDQEYLKIAVCDQGFGIKKEDIPFLFDKFFRVRNNKTRYITGTGLGLPIVKQIVDAHLGVIQVTSEENKGSIFTIYLPAIIKQDPRVAE